MINKNKKIKQNQGQVAIVVLLASAIILTLGLSASKKSITDTKIDTDEQLLKEAFNTAESGINSYINDSANREYSSGSGGNAQINTSIIGGGTTISSEGKVLANNNQLFWLVNHEENGEVGSTYYSGPNISVSVDSDFVGALKIDYFYKNGDVYGVSRMGSNFHLSNTTVNGYGQNSSKSFIVNLSAGNPLLIVVTPIGGSTRIYLNGSAYFPNQGEEITSVGTAGGLVKTQIKTRRTYQIPPFFIEAITAKNIIK